MGPGLVQCARGHCPAGQAFQRPWLESDFGLENSWKIWGKSFLVLYFLSHSFYYIRFLCPVTICLERPPNLC